MNFDLAIVDPAALTPAERTELVELVNAAFRRHAWLFPVDRIDDASFAEEVAVRQLLLLRSSGRVVAMAAFTAEQGVLHFGMAVVAPDLHGQGVGRALMSALEARARELGATAIEIETVQQIGNADYYARLGYVITSAQTRPAGTWGALQPFTLVQMCKRLRPQ